MRGLGTLINVAAIVAGGLVGMIGGRCIKERWRETLMKAMGICVIMVGIAGVLQEMLIIKDGSLGSQGTLMMIVSVALGALFGEMINIDGGFERFGKWLQQKTGNARDSRFLDAFISASMTVCIGAMAIVGSVEDGISGDFTTLAAKALLDFVIILVMTCSMGKGCIFSAIPVGLLQGSVTLLASAVQPYMTAAALSNLSLVGSLLITCVGINIIWKDTVRTANLLPSLLIAVAWAIIGK